MAKLLKMFGCTRKDPYDSSEDEDDTKKFNNGSTSPQNKSSKLKEENNTHDNANVSHTASIDSPQSPHSPKTSEPEHKNNDVSLVDMEKEKEIEKAPQNTTQTTTSASEDVVKEVQQTPIKTEPAPQDDSNDFENLRTQAKKVQDDMQPKKVEPPATTTATTSTPQGEGKWEKLKNERLDEDSSADGKEDHKTEESEDDKWARLRRQRMENEEEQSS
eukprot:TRINITY_DN15832_c0_g1_i1.p1 TRINITY_DN15832_c0_g1~~TRINITY_DN15832_c0_g1_i1.p1  ORF type:complete len:217 (+),score=63.75 TRINITY_DN15832_c0_g1_i1:51-701(+)